VLRVEYQRNLQLLEEAITSRCVVSAVRDQCRLLSFLLESCVKICCWVKVTTLQLPSPTSYVLHQHQIYYTYFCRWIKAASTKERRLALWRLWKLRLFLLWKKLNLGKHNQWLVYMLEHHSQSTPNLSYINRRSTEASIIPDFLWMVRSFSSGAEVWGLSRDSNSQHTIMLRVLRHSQEWMGLVNQ